MNLFHGAVLGAVIVVIAASSSSSVRAENMQYPESKTVDVVDDYHGTAVADPYRWLEDPDSDDTRAWVEAQNEVTFGYLNELPTREKLRQRITELWDYPKYGTPWSEGGKTFYFKNDGLQNQSILYVQHTPGADPVVLLDPNGLSEDGTVALGGLSISEDGRYMAYALSQSGSDWRTWRVRDIDTQTDLEDVIEWTKFTGASWLKDASGFFYSAYDPPKEGDEYEQANYFQKLYFHRLGTAQAEDVLVYERRDEKEWGFGGSVTEDGEFLIISVWQGTDPRNRVFYKSLTTADAEVVELLTERDAAYSFVGNDGPVFYFRTDLDASRGRLVAIDTTAPSRENWKTLIAEDADVLQSVGIVNEMFVCNYMHDAHDQVRLHDMSGAFVRNVTLPSLGSVGGFGGKRSDTDAFYSFTSFLYPTVIYRYDFATDQSTVFRAPEIDFDFDAYTAEQIFYESKDGTKVPMFLVHRKDIELNGENPALLYGYGGFNVSLTPSFSVRWLTWLELGGVVAVANLRGGGEYGEDWHQGGMIHNKQNVFDDFIAAGEYLCANGYTNPSKLACMGGSNGGLLVGAVVNQRPDLFGAALPAVGVMDMLRFQKFTIGWAWVSDYGSSDDPEQFDTLYKYSPYHNLDSREYPAIMVTTADHDDRVVPGHSFKYAARLQSVQTGEAPVLIRIETKAGHGAGKPTSKSIEEMADVYAFLIANLNMQLH